MERMDPELVRKELIDRFDFILELDRRPELLEKLPDKSVMVKKGGRRFVIPATRKPKIIML